MQLEKKHDMRCKFAPAPTSTCPRSTNTTTLHIAHSHYHIFTWPYIHVPGNDLIQTQNHKHCKDSFHLLNWKLKLKLKIFAAPELRECGSFVLPVLGPRAPLRRYEECGHNRWASWLWLGLKMQDSYVYQQVALGPCLDGRLQAFSIACCLHYFFHNQILNPKCIFVWMLYPC